MPQTTRKASAPKPARSARARRAAAAAKLINTATTVNVHEAKTHLSRLLARVERGEHIKIARAGRAVAVMSPAPAAEPRPLPPDDPLLNLDKFSVDGPGGAMTNEDIDRILYGEK